MATKVHMEALSPTMEEGQVVKWLKSEGDAVANGDVIAEIETDKATMELVARGDGILRRVLLGEGGVAPVGDVIAVIAAEDEDISALVPAGAGGGAGSGDAASEAEGEDASAAESTGGGGAGSEAGAGAAPAAAAGQGSAGAAEGHGGGADSTTAATGPDGRLKASPLARRLAEEAGLSLGAVSGSGPGGRIVKRDVESAMESGVGAAPAAAPSAPSFAVPPADGPEYEDIPLTQIRKTIAKRLSQSLGPVPHFFLTVDLDMTRAMAARARINAWLEKDGLKVSVNDMVLKATAAALRMHPECNAHWMGDSIRRFNRVHLGVAVAVEDGLITPVIRDAERKGIATIAQEVREMSGRAREKKLKPEEYTGSTFSVSNLGMFGIHEFTAVINPPEAGILAVGAMEETPVFVDGELVAQPRMRITMSCDHRVIDGATGAKFLQTLRAFLEEPATALVV